MTSWVRVCCDFSTLLTPEAFTTQSRLPRSSQILHGQCARNRGPCTSYISLSDLTGTIWHKRRFYDSGICKFVRSRNTQCLLRILYTATGVQGALKAFSGQLSHVNFCLTCDSLGQHCQVWVGDLLQRSRSSTIYSYVKQLGHESPRTSPHRGETRYPISWTVPSTKPSKCFNMSRETGSFCDCKTFISRTRLCGCRAQIREDLVRVKATSQQHALIGGWFWSEGHSCQASAMSRYNSTVLLPACLNLAVATVASCHNLRDLNTIAIRQIIKSI